MGLLSLIKGLFSDPRMTADEKIPLRRWTRAAIAIITGGDDYGYFPKNRVAPLLEEMWDVTGADSAKNTIAVLQKGTSAWDLVRALHVARMSVGAEFIDAETGWTLVAPIAQKLQSVYDTWDAVAADYFDSRTVWARETNLAMPTKEEFQDDIDVTKSVYWDEIDFKHDLTKTAF